ncbi:MAG: gamma-glutamyltransferase [Acidobacteriota bacterium]
MIRRACTVALLCTFVAVCTPQSVRSLQSVGKTAQHAEGRLGLVSSAHPLATDAGLDVLRAGGNAFDAAVAVAAALNVTEPAMSGLGGYGTILVYDARDDRVRLLNSSGRIPIGTNSDLFRAPTPDFEKNRTGARAVSTPGNLHAWEAMSKKHGRLKWAELLAPAIRLAEQGFVLRDADAAVLQRAFGTFPDHAKAFFGRDGTPLSAGDRLIQRDLARTLKTIAARGPDMFYKGEIGVAIHKAMLEAGGFLSIEDLRRDKAEWWDAISVEYRGYEVYTASPPANAFDYLVRLGLMSQFNSKTLGHNTAAWLHHFAEVTKHGFWVRLRYAGDPDVAPPPLDWLLSQTYWKQEAARIDPRQAKPFVPPSSPGGGSDPDSHTTHFVVADRWGNVVSATQTLGNAFGSRIMPEGTGIWLNNSLAYSTFEPKGNPMDAHAGRRKLSGDCPTIVLRNQRPWAALGTPGGHTIGQIVAQIVMNLIDFRMGIAEAIAAPRISFVEPDVLAVEAAVPQDVRDALAALGHKVQVTRGLGNAHGLMIEYNSENEPVRFVGASDPRGAGAAKGY